MFNVIRKTEYWDALNNPVVFRKLGGFTLKALDGLKHIQDAWTLNRVHQVRNARVLEIGGGLSRVLPAMDESNERWNLDEFLGEGNGVLEAPDMPGIKLLRKTMGSFAPELGDGYFDLAFSISVIEHIPHKALDDFWRDHARVLAPGGLAIHTIDLYLGDEPDSGVAGRMKFYREMPARYGLVPVDIPAVGDQIAFECDMASNSDWGMWRWNKNVPALRDTRAVCQSVSLGMILRKA